jgi:hypothetical protein
VGGTIPHRTVNKEASLRRQEWCPVPTNLEAGKLVTVTVVRGFHWRVRKRHFPCDL